MDLSNIYITRHLLQTNSIRIPYINNNSGKLLFVITNSCPKEHILTPKISANLISEGLTNITDRTQIILGGQDDFNEICKTRSNVHEVHHNGSSILKWVQAAPGSDLTLLRENGLIPDQFSKIETRYDRPVTIIYADRGMGKTSFIKDNMKNISDKNPEAVTIMLNNIKLSRFFNKSGLKNVDSFIDFFKIDTNNPDIHLMFDNYEDLPKFDDIINIMVDLYKKFKNVKLWITCCKIETKKELESKLGAFACYLSPLSRESQIGFLKDAWDIKDDISENYATTMLKLFNEIHWKQFIENPKTNLYYEYTSYPLHLKNIAKELKPESDMLLNDVDILSVYDHFVKKSCDFPYRDELAVSKVYGEVPRKFNFRKVFHFTDFYFEQSKTVVFCAAKWFFKNRYSSEEELPKFLISDQCPADFIDFFNRFCCRDSSLHNAVVNNNLELIKEICSSANINEVDSVGRTPLHLANSVEVIEVLIKNGADINKTDEVLQWTPLQYFDFYGNMEGIDVLLSNGGNIKQLNKTLGLEPSELSKRFVYAMKKKLLNYLKFICQNCPNLKVTALNISECFFYLPPEYIMMILKRTETTDTIDSDGKDRRFNIDFSGKTALFYAAKRNYLEIMKYMVEHLKFDVYAKTYITEDTAFHEACKYGNKEIVEYLLSKGVDINLQSARNSNAFMDCCRDNNVEMIKFLVPKGIKTDICLIWDETPYEVACANGSVDVVKYLLENSKELKLTCKLNTIQSLHGAVNSSSIELVKLVLEGNQFDINEEVRGTTALHIACGKDNIEIVQLLIEAGADVNSNNPHSYRTPLFEAHFSNNIEILKLLVEHGGDLLHTDKERQTILHRYVDHEGDPDIDILKEFIEFVLDKGIDINIRDSLNNTPLHLASCPERVEIFKFLVEHGADVNAVNFNGETPSQRKCRICNYRRIPCCTMRTIW